MQLSGRGRGWMSTLGMLSGRSGGRSRLPVVPEVRSGPCGLKGNGEGNAAASTPAYMGFLLCSRLQSWTGSGNSLGTVSTEHLGGVFSFRALGPSGGGWGDLWWGWCGTEAEHPSQHARQQPRISANPTAAQKYRIHLTALSPLAL